MEPCSELPGQNARLVRSGIVKSLCLEELYQKPQSAGVTSTVAMCFFSLSK